MPNNLKPLLPFATAAAGAGASYYFLGKEKKNGKRVPREGLEPWAVAVGGALVGYIAGQFVASRLKPPPAPAPAPQAIPKGTPPEEEYVDLDEAPRGLPAAPMSTAPGSGMEPDVRAGGSEDGDLLSSMGAFAGSGEGGMGSFGGSYGNLDDVETDAIS